MTKCQPKPENKVESSYAGNVNDSDCKLTGTKKYPGLKSSELNTAKQYYAFEYWTGIDCAGFVQRMVMASNKLGLPGLVSGIGNLTDTDKDGNHLDDGGIKSEAFFTDARRTLYIANPETDEERVRLMRKLRKGDLVKYKGHITAISSDKPTCNDSACSYDIIHASGTQYVCYSTPNQADKCQFNRKVVVNTINEYFKAETLKKPAGFGRIKIWD